MPKLNLYRRYKHILKSFIPKKRRVEDSGEVEYRANERERDGEYLLLADTIFFLPSPFRKITTFSRCRANESSRQNK